MGEPIKECWDRRQYHTGLAHIKRNRRTQFGILGAAIKPKWDGPTYPKGMTQLTNVAGPTLVKPAGPLQVSGLKILTSQSGLVKCDWVHSVNIGGSSRQSSAASLMTEITDKQSKRQNNIKIIGLYFEFSRFGFARCIGLTVVCKKPDTSLSG